MKLKKKRRRKVKYNEKYDLYIDDDLVIYYWDKRLNKLMQRTISENNCGYLMVHTKIGRRLVHRIIYETFVGEIPEGMEIDHIKGNKTDNRPEMLKCVSHKENCDNPSTATPSSEFGKKFKEYYGITRHQNTKLYNKEYWWYIRNGKCRWEE